MSYSSCLTAAQALMVAALPTFNVKLFDDEPSPYTRDRYPLLLLAHGQAREKRLGLPVQNSVPPGGRKLRWWPMTAFMWNYEPGPTFDESTWLGYVEAAENAIRLNDRLFNSILGVDADTTTTFVLTAAEDSPQGIGIQSKTHGMWDGKAGVTRYGEIVFLIREGVNG